MVDERGAGGDELLEQLYAGAQHHARSANLKFDSPDPGVRMDAAIHIGAAVELMAKAVLVKVDPRLIAAEQTALHALIDVLEERGEIVARRSQPGRRTQTVAATRAVDLAARLAPTMHRHASAAKDALHVRNDAAHAAAVDDGQLRTRVSAATRFVLAGVDHLDRRREDFLGPKLSLVVATIAEDVSAALRARADTKVALAKNGYRSVMAQFPFSSPEQLLELRGSEDSMEAFYISEEQACPACSNQGVVLLDIDMIDGPENPDYIPSLIFVGYRCRYCHLQLEEQEWVALGYFPFGNPADAFDVVEDEEEDEEDAQEVRRVEDGVGAAPHALDGAPGPEDGLQR